MEANYFTILWCFLAIHQNESAMGAYMSPILKSPPTSLPPHPSGLFQSRALKASAQTCITLHILSSGSSQCTNPEHPVLCIESGLEIYFIYDNTHDSMLFSQIIPPLPSPRVQTSVLYICVSFAILHTGLSLPSF